MSRRILSVLTMMLLVLLIGLLLAACGGAEEQEKATPAASEGKTLLEERCTKCHDLGRVERARKTEEEWEQTVTRMVGKGAQLNAGEQATLIEYLAETYGP